MERTVRNVPKFHNTFLDLREEDNLSIVDKMAGPNVFLNNFGGSSVVHV